MLPIRLSARAVALCALMMIASSSSQGATATGSFAVQMTVTAACTITSASTLDFGAQSTFSASVDQTSTIQVQCTNTTPYNIGLNSGTGTGATVTTRKMTSGGNSVNYQLFRDSGRTQNWGNTVGTDTLSGTGSGSAQNITVYGRVPTQTAPAPGTYTDTITITVNY